MAWLVKAEAAHRMGVSLRTLSDRLTAGALESKREGHRVLVYVPDRAVSEDSPAMESRVATRAVAAGEEPEPFQDEAMSARALEAMRETRAVLEANLRAVRAQADCARQAEDRAGRLFARAGVGFVIAVGIMLVAVVATGWYFHQKTTALAGELAGLRLAVSAIEASVIHVEDTLASEETRLAEGRAEFTKRVESMQDGLVELEFALSTQADEQGARLAVMGDTLAPLKRGQAELSRDLVLLRGEHSEVDGELCELEERMQSLEGVTTLHHLLERTWGLPESDQVRRAASTD